MPYPFINLMAGEELLTEWAVCPIDSPPTSLYDPSDEWKYSINAVVPYTANTSPGNATVFKKAFTSGVEVTTWSLRFRGRISNNETSSEHDILTLNNPANFNAGGLKITVKGNKIIASFKPKGSPSTFEIMGALPSSVTGNFTLDLRYSSRLKMYINGSEIITRKTIAGAVGTTPVGVTPCTLQFGQIATPSNSLELIIYELQIYFGINSSVSGSVDGDTGVWTPSPMEGETSDARNITVDGGATAPLFSGMSAVTMYGRDSLAPTNEYPAVINDGKLHKFGVAFGLSGNTKKGTDIMFIDKHDDFRFTQAVPINKPPLTSYLHDYANDVITLVPSGNLYDGPTSDTFGLISLKENIQGGVQVKDFTYNGDTLVIPHDLKAPIIAAFAVDDSGRVVWSNKFQEKTMAPSFYHRRSNPLQADPLMFGGDTTEFFTILGDDAVKGGKSISSLPKIVQHRCFTDRNGRRVFMRGAGNQGNADGGVPLATSFVSYYVADDDLSKMINQRNQFIIGYQTEYMLMDTIEGADGNWYLMGMGVPPTTSNSSIKVTWHKWDPVTLRFVELWSTNARNLDFFTGHTYNKRRTVRGFKLFNIEPGTDNFGIMIASAHNKVDSERDKVGLHFINGLTPTSTINLSANAETDNIIGIGQNTFAPDLLRLDVSIDKANDCYYVSCGVACDRSNDSKEVRIIGGGKIGENPSNLRLEWPVYCQYQNHDSERFFTDSYFSEAAEWVNHNKAVAVETDDNRRFMVRSSLIRNEKGALAAVTPSTILVTEILTDAAVGTSEADAMFEIPHGQAEHRDIEDFDATWHDGYIWILATTFEHPALVGSKDLVVYKYDVETAEMFVVQRVINDLLDVNRFGVPSISSTSRGMMFVVSTHQAHDALTSTTPTRAYLFLYDEAYEAFLCYDFHGNSIPRGITERSPSKLILIAENSNIKLSHMRAVTSKNFNDVRPHGDYKRGMELDVRSTFDGKGMILLERPDRPKTNAANITAMKTTIKSFNFGTGEIGIANQQTCTAYGDTDVIFSTKHQRLIGVSPVDKTRFGSDHGYTSTERDALDLVAFSGPVGGAHRDSDKDNVDEGISPFTYMPFDEVASPGTINALSESIYDAATMMFTAVDGNDYVFFTRHVAGKFNILARYDDSNDLILISIPDHKTGELCTVKHQRAIIGGTERDLIFCMNRDNGGPGFTQIQSFYFNGTTLVDLHSFSTGAVIGTADVFVDPSSNEITMAVTASADVAEGDGTKIDFWYNADAAAGTMTKVSSIDATTKAGTGRYSYPLLFKDDNDTTTRCTVSFRETIPSSGRRTPPHYGRTITMPISSGVIDSSSEVEWYSKLQKCKVTSPPVKVNGRLYTAGFIYIPTVHSTEISAPPMNHYLTVVLIFDPKAAGWVLADTLSDTEVGITTSPAMRSSVSFAVNQPVGAFFGPGLKSVDASATSEKERFLHSFMNATTATEDTFTDRLQATEMNGRLNMYDIRTAEAEYSGRFHKSLRTMVTIGTKEGSSSSLDEFVVDPAWEDLEHRYIKDMPNRAYPYMTWEAVDGNASYYAYTGGTSVTVGRNGEIQGAGPFVIPGRGKATGNFYFEVRLEAMGTANPYSLAVIVEDEDGQCYGFYSASSSVTPNPSDAKPSVIEASVDKETVVGFLFNYDTDTRTIYVNGVDKGNISEPFPEKDLRIRSYVYRTGTGTTEDTTVLFNFGQLEFGSEDVNLGIDTSVFTAPSAVYGNGERAVVIEALIPKFWYFDDNRTWQDFTLDPGVRPPTSANIHRTTVSSLKIWMATFSPVAIFEYDIATGVWSDITAGLGAPTWTADFDIAGYEDQFIVSSDEGIYINYGGIWTQIGTLGSAPTKGKLGSLRFVDGNAYVVGKTDSLVHRYRLTSGQWTILGTNEIVDAIYGTGAPTINDAGPIGCDANRLIVSNNTGTSVEFYIRDYIQNTWRQISTAGVTLRNASSLELRGNVLYATFTNATIFKCDLETETWTELTLLSGHPSWIRLSGITADPDGSKVFVSDRNLKQIWKLDLTTNTWSDESGGTSAPTLVAPTDVFYDDTYQRLYVADKNASTALTSKTGTSWRNHMSFPGAPTINDASAVCHSEGLTWVADKSANKLHIVTILEAWEEVYTGTDFLGRTGLNRLAVWNKRIYGSFVSIEGILDMSPYGTGGKRTWDNGNAMAIDQDGNVFVHDIGKSHAGFYKAPHWIDIPHVADVGSVYSAAGASVSEDRYMVVDNILRHSYEFDRATMTWRDITDDANSPTPHRPIVGTFIEDNFVSVDSVGKYVMVHRDREYATPGVEVGTPIEDLNPKPLSSDELPHKFHHNFTGDDFVQAVHLRENNTTSVVIPGMQDKDVFFIHSEDTSQGTRIVIPEVSKTKYWDIAGPTFGAKPSPSFFTVNASDVTIDATDFARPGNLYVTAFKKSPCYGIAVQTVRGTGSLGDREFSVEAIGPPKAALILPHGNDEPWWAFRRDSDGRYFYTPMVTNQQLVVQDEDFLQFSASEDGRCKFVSSGQSNVPDLNEAGRVSTIIFFNEIPGTLNVRVTENYSRDYAPITSLDTNPIVGMGKAALADSSSQSDWWFWSPGDIMMGGTVSYTAADVNGSALGMAYSANKSISYGDSTYWGTSGNLSAGYLGFGVIADGFVSNEGKPASDYTDELYSLHIVLGNGPIIYDPSGNR